jgi:MoaA/NifB/PqqE/SkfB family radical SAM enzyme
MSGNEWIEALERLPISDTLPATLQGGEPTIYPDFYTICKQKSLWGKMDLLTNGVFSIDEFCSKVDPRVFKRNAPYASIRVSWHVGQNDGMPLLNRVHELQTRGYQVGIWAVDHPEQHSNIIDWQLRAWELGIDFRLKEFLGPHGGREYGTFKYPDSVNASSLRFCECRTSELLISPDGKVYRCHSDLYAARLPIGHILDTDIALIGKWIPCAVLGKCNSCDIKVKNNRFQEFGYSSVNIRNITEPYSPNRDHQTQVVNTYGKADNKPIK